MIFTARMAIVMVLAALGSLVAAHAGAQATLPATTPATTPATLAQVTMSADATKRAHLQEINVDTAMKLVNACIDYSKGANPSGGASVVVIGPSGNIVVAIRTDGQIPNNFDSAYQKAKTALYMRQPTRALVNRWGSPEPAIARARSTCTWWRAAIRLSWKT